MRGRTLLVLGVLLVTLSGCLSTPVAEPENRTETATSTPLSPTETTGQTTETAMTPESPTETGSPSTTSIAYDCGYTLHVEAASDGQEASTDRTVDYSDLSEARQREFLEARQNRTVDLGDDLPETWSSPVVVRYDGTPHYAVASTC